MGRRREEKRRRRGRSRRRAKGMELVWNDMICMEKSNHKPLFFFMNLGLKEPYLVYWWCLVVLD